MTSHRLYINVLMVVLVALHGLQVKARKPIREPPAEESQNDNVCVQESEGCTYDTDCCEPPDDDGMECSQQKCQMCGGMTGTCKSERDCCEVLSCRKNMCCAPIGHNCQFDIDCCQKPPTICAKGSSILPGQPLKCKRGNGKKPDLRELDNLNRNNPFLVPGADLSGSKYNFSSGDPVNKGRSRGERRKRSSLLLPYT